MMPYSPDYDRLFQEVRALGIEEERAAKALAAAKLAPRERAVAAASLLGIRARLSAVVAGLSEGQAGVAHAWFASEALPVAGHAVLSDALLQMERRLTGLREQPLAPY